MRLCEFDNCGRKHHGKGFCSKHYYSEVFSNMEHRESTKLCEIEGCDIWLFAKGLCKKHYHSKVYLTNLTPDRVVKNRANMKLLKKRNANYLVELKNNPCSDCKIQYPSYVMQFDHVRGEKSFDLANYGTSSTARILEESLKCDLVCSNCHAERTHHRRVVKRT